MNNLSYPYKPNLWTVFLAALLFGVIAYFLAQEAMSNQRGLILNGIIYFSPAGATIFYWCIAAGGGMFAAMAVPLFLRGLTTRHHVTLTATEISAPMHAYSRSTTVVALAEITRLEVQDVQQQRFLNIYHSNGKLTISQHLLPSVSAFEELRSAVLDRVSRLSRN